MSDVTQLDAAHALMEASPEDERLRLRFYECVGDSELFLLLGDEAQGSTVKPEVFEVEDGQFVLAFDREERMAQFSQRPVPYVALAGRVLARMLAEQNLGMGLNLDVAPSSILIPAQAMRWLAGQLEHAPDQVESRLSEIFAPINLPEAVIAALDRKIASASGLAKTVYVAGATREDQSTGYLLAFVDAKPDAHAALAGAIAEAVNFSGNDELALDVTFIASSEPLHEKLARVGLRFEVPLPPEPKQIVRNAPGTNPDKPPILR